MFDWTEVEKNGYYARDIFSSKGNSTFKPINKQGKIDRLFKASSNQSIEIQTFYLGNLMGMVHILKPKAGVIGKEFASSLTFHLNNNMSYYLLINDPNISITNMNHGIVPKLFATLIKPAKAEHTFLIIKVTPLISILLYQ